jgi:hypothetical protein
MTWKTDEFFIYDIDHRVKNGKLQIKLPHYKRYYGIETKTGQKILNQQTDNEITLLQEDPPVDLGRVVQYQGDDKHTLYNKINPLIDDRVVVNVNRGDTFERIVAANTTFTKEDGPEAYKDLAQLLFNFGWHRADYINDDPILLQVVQIPAALPPVAGMREGEFNCAIKPIYEAVKQKKPTPRNKRMLKKLEALNAEYFNTGIDADGLAKLCTVAECNIRVQHGLGGEWANYHPYKGKKTWLYTAHNNHMTIEKPIDMNLFNNQGIVWIHDGNFNDLNKKYVDAKPIHSKGGQVALITRDTIYKKPFPECEMFPHQFTEGGVAKAKIIAQHSFIEKGQQDSIYSSIFHAADMSGFYLYGQDRISNENTQKYDMVHAFKSFSNSPANFNGFPIITDIQTLNGRIGDIYDMLPEHGLVYITTIDNKNNTTLKETDFPFDTCPTQLYYECVGWYPVEIVKFNYNKDPVLNNVKICQIAPAVESFNIDFSNLTNHQFRCFIGKCSVKMTSDTWRTTDINELNACLFYLKDRVIGYRKYHDFNTDIYEVEYKLDQKPWQYPIIAAYVKAHQKVLLFQQYNKLIDNGIYPTAISVDSIKCPTPCNELFNIGANEGQWRLEQPTRAQEMLMRYAPREIIPPYNNPNVYSKPLERLTHIQGAAGSGKTHTLIELYKRHPETQVLTPTNKTADALIQAGIPAMTFHRVFGIGCRSDYTMTKRYMLDEVSMVSTVDLKTIDQSLQIIHKNKQPFGGCSFYIFGDFKQLKPVLGEVLTDSDIYKLFNVHTLTENWRQKDDVEFYNILDKVRDAESGAYRRVEFDIDKAAADRLNQRVLPLPKYDGIDDLYLCSTNDACDIINAKYTWTDGVKVMSNKACEAVYYTNFEKFKRRLPKGTVGILKSPLSTQRGVDYLCVVIDAVEYHIREIKKIFDIKIAMTVHKAQGITARGNVVIDPVRMWEPAHFYVALSRATKLNNVYFTSPPIGVSGNNYYLNK